MFSRRKSPDARLQKAIWSDGNVPAAASGDTSGLELGHPGNFPSDEMQMRSTTRPKSAGPHGTRDLPDAVAAMHEVPKADLTESIAEKARALQRQQQENGGDRKLYMGSNTAAAAGDEYKSVPQRQRPATASRCGRGGHKVAANGVRPQSAGAVGRRPSRDSNGSAGQFAIGHGPKSAFQGPTPQVPLTQGELWRERIKRLKRPQSAAAVASRGRITLPPAVSPEDGTFGVPSLRVKAGRRSSHVDLMRFENTPVSRQYQQYVPSEWVREVREHAREVIQGKFKKKDDAIEAAHEAARSRSPSPSLVLDSFLLFVKLHLYYEKRRNDLNCVVAFVHHSLVFK